METGKNQKRPEPLKNAVMKYAPENELGVVFLFSQIARKKGWTVEKIQSAFPDCIAYGRTGDGEKPIRIEFEFRSSNFKNHKHEHTKCDLLVCWEHNWPGKPESLNILELRREFGLGFNVWTLAVAGKYKEEISHITSDEWTVSSLASKGDLILFYLSNPDMCIQDIFKVVGDVEYKSIDSNDWNQRRKDYFAPIRRISKLKAPIFWEDLQRDRILKTSNFVRARMQGRPRATEYWPYLYEMIIRRNPEAGKRLKKYSPENLS